MEQPQPISSADNFKDRRTGLKVFGAAVVVVGVLCAVIAFLTGLVSWLFSTSVDVDHVDTPSAGPAILLYAVCAVVLISLGVGSIKLRRWARALLLIVAWIWLLAGIIGIAGMAIVLPAFLALAGTPDDPTAAGMRSVMAAVTLGTLSIVLVVLPGSLVLFYRSRHVRATIEAYDRPRWTDACPEAVLGLSLSLWLAAASVLPQALIHPALPLFGTVLTGVPAATGWLLFAVLWAYCAWATYKMRPRGWWATLISFAVLAAGWLITVKRLPTDEMYRAMGYPEPQIRQLRGIISHSAFVAFGGAISAAFFAYLIYMKRYFRFRG